MPKSQTQLLVALTTGTQAFGAAVALLVSLMMARVVGAEGRGLVAFSLQLAYVLVPILTLGLNRYLLRADWDMRPSLSSLLLVPTTAGLVLAAALALGGASPSVYLAPVVSIGVAGVLIVRSDAIARRTTRLFAVASFSTSTFVLASSALLAAFSVSAPTVWLLPYVAVGVIAASAALVGLRASRVGLSRQIRGGIGQVPGEFGQLIALRLDRLLLPVLCTSSDLGVYVMAATALEAAMWLVDAVADSRVKRVSADKRVTVWRLLMSDLVWLPALTIAAALGTRFVLIPFLGEEFQSGIDLILPLSIGTVLLGLSKLLGSYLLGGARPTKANYPRVVMAIVAMPTYYFAVREACACGAAWATVAVYAVGFVSTLVLALGKR